MQKKGEIAEADTKERLIIELESEGTDFHTVFKNQMIAKNGKNDYLVKSIVENLSIRGFDFKNQVISYFSKQ